MEKIAFEEYSKVAIQVGKITEAERVPNSNKMIRMAVSFGGDNMKQILTNIGNQFSPEQLIGLRTLFVVNLMPVTIMGFESDGMIFTGKKEDNSAYIIEIGEGVELGSKVG
jgi:methionyl-tRNA synthetase